MMEIGLEALEKYLISSYTISCVKQLKSDKISKMMENKDKFK